MNWRMLVAFLVVVAVSAYFVNAHAAEEAQTNYENQIASCQSGGPLRQGVVLALETAEKFAREGNERYAAAILKIVNAPFTRPNGTRECRKAVIHP